MDNVITNTFVVQNPEIDNVRNILKDYVKKHHYRSIQFNKLFPRFYSNINYVRKQGLELISVHEIKIVFRSYFRNITFRHYLEIPKPIIETILNKKICSNPKLIDVLIQINKPHSALLPLFFRFYPLEEETDYE